MSTDAPLLSTVDVPCPDCGGTGDNIHVASKMGECPPCPRCEGRGTVKSLFFTCPLCCGHGDPWPCPDPNHDLHGPVTVARLEPWGTGPTEALWSFRKVAEWRADE